MTALRSLIAAIDAATDCAERTALVERCSREQLKQLHAALTYRRLNAAVAARIAAFPDFSGELDRAPDDGARLWIIEAAQHDPQRGPAWLAEWSWQRRATENDWHARYMAMLDGKSAP